MSVRRYPCRRHAPFRPAIDEPTEGIHGRTVGDMTSERAAAPTDPWDGGAATLLRSVGLMADGPVVWGRPVPARGPGIFVIELPAPLHHAPLELTRIGKWLERVPDLRLDGARPTSRLLSTSTGARPVNELLGFFTQTNSGTKEAGVR